MLAEDLKNRSRVITTAKHSFNNDVWIDNILDSLKQTSDSFLDAIESLPEDIKPLNEDKLTQIFVEQNDVILRNNKTSIGVKNQYSDIFFGSKGVPDFYYHSLEQGIYQQAIFVVEAKRLPAPSLKREKEYVIGKSKNGGIERFKFKIHGAGHNRFAIIGFVEKESFDFWHKKINCWIKELPSPWSKKEVLKIEKACSNYSTFNSIVVKEDDTCNLFHQWIYIKALSEDKA